MEPITNFKGKYRWLSNFYPCSVYYEHDLYPTVENAYQAAKTSNRAYRIPFMTTTPGEAKRMGQNLELRPEWEQVKELIMDNLLKQKFYKPYLRNLLLETGDAILMEGNTWGDVYWGVRADTLVGENRLGKLIMEIREELRIPK